MYQYEVWSDSEDLGQFRDKSVNLFAISSDKYFSWLLVNTNSSFTFKILLSWWDFEFPYIADKLKVECEPNSFVYFRILFDLILFWLSAEKVVIDRIIIVFCYQGEHLLGAEIAFKITNIINKTELRTARDPMIGWLLCHTSDLTTRLGKVMHSENGINQMSGPVAATT